MQQRSAVPQEALVLELLNKGPVPWEMGRIQNGGEEESELLKKGSW